MNTTAAHRPVPAFVRIGRRTYAVATDGWCEELHCFIARDATGHLVTIPVEAL